MKNFNSRFLIFIACAAGILLIFGWHMFVYEPTQREILNMQLETRRLREVERSIAEFKARHEDLSAFGAVKERQLDEARNFLPATLAQDKFLDGLYRAAEICRVRLTAVQTGEIISADEMQMQLVTVKAEADFVALLNFIRETVDGGRLVGLENFLLTSTGDDVISCELTFKIFAAP